MRILIPLLAVVLGGLVFLAIATRDPGNTPNDPPETTVEETVEAEAEVGAEDAATTDAAEADSATADATVPETVDTTTEAADSSNTTEPIAAPAASETANATSTPPTDLQLAAVPASEAADATLGGLTPDGDYRLQAEFTRFGAGVKRIQLADYAETIGSADRYTLLDAGATPSFYTLAARAIMIDGQTINLNDKAWNLEAEFQHDTGSTTTYALELINETTGERIGEVRRVWTLPKDSYELRLEQSFVNHTDRDVAVAFRQYGVGDLLMDRGAYIGDQRKLVTGYFRSSDNPPKTNIYVTDAFWNRSSLVKDSEPAIWPSEYVPGGSTLAWIAAENRYFALVTHMPLPDAKGDGTALRTPDIPSLEQRFPTVDVLIAGNRSSAETADLIIALGTDTQGVAAGGTLDLSLDIYAGPRKKEVFAEAPYGALHFDKLIRYELGCTWCTFQWLAKGLLGYLKLLESVVFDWGVAIILLVLTVRLLLHPITKRAQGNMMKMGKQMQAIQPEMQKLKEKYKDDPQKMNAEVMKLYREKGINPAGMLGCLPMLLQMPIWIALYAMLYLAIELRHEQAFYGVFQAISNGTWPFLADLSVSDRFIPIFAEKRTFNLLFLIVDYSAINILPLLMGVVFYFNMKFTTPPPATPEQAQQQKIMKIIPFTFPIFLYSAPAGLTLYITASTLAGIVDSYIVRRHIKQQEEDGTLFDKKEVKPGSFRWKMQQRIQAAQEMAQQRMEEQQKTQKKNVANTANKKRKRK
ncbi:MAG: YidC/Oxa1 family insertase periplasmic-domain containing protein [Planctomycetota bacterium]